MSVARVWLRLLAAVPVVAVPLAALDTVLVRLALPYRPTEPRLFGEALALWLCFALLATVPAALCAGLFARRRAAGVERAPLAVGALLLGWTLLPVVTHAILDRFTALANDTEGRIAGLASPWPWLEVALFVGGGGVLLFLSRRPLQRLGAGLPALALLAVATLVGLFLPRGGAPSGPPAVQASSAPAATPGARPNLLLLVWDTCRRDRLEVYDWPRDTSPNLARLAQSALVVDQARSASVFTFSSHLTLLTGVYPSHHGGRLLSTRYDPSRAESIAERLRQAGYRTGGFVGTDVLAGRTGIRYGFDVYDDEVDPPVCDTHGWKLVHDVQALLAARFAFFHHNGRPHWFQDFQRPGSEVLDRALAWIRRDDPRPWFCLINLYDVHWPYTPAPADAAELVRPYDGPMDGYLFRSDRWKAGYRPTEADARHISELYEAEMHGLDAVVGRFLGALDLDHTALVMTGDHGEALGEAGQWKHENIYEPQVRVPLLVRPPGGLPSERRVEAHASGIDVAPTLLALAGLDPGPHLDGESLLPLLDAKDPPPERALLVEDRDHVDPTDVRVALYHGPWKLVRFGLGKQERYELHDLRTDPIGEVDVAAAHPDVLADLRARLTELRRAGDRDDLEVGEGVAGQADALRGLGYTGGR